MAAYHGRWHVRQPSHPRSSPWRPSSRLRPSGGGADLPRVQLPALVTRFEVVVHEALVVAAELVLLLQFEGRAVDVPICPACC